MPDLSGSRPDHTDAAALRGSPDGGETSSPASAGGWRTWVGLAVSAALVAAILLQLGHTSFEALGMLARLPWTVWIVFGLLYLAQPLADLVVFRRLWNLPISGFAALLRKNVINEIVFGYSGEVYLYLWARRRAGLSNPPLHAIKDSNILSALVANTWTLGLLAVTTTTLSNLDLVHKLGPALWPGVALAAAPFVVLVFAHRVFSLSPRDLAFVAEVHAARTLAASGFTILLWWLAMPQIGFGVCIALLATRLVIGRLPFLTNKDLVFGNVILLLAGPHAPISMLLAALALATLFAHLSTIGLLGLRDLIRTVGGTPGPA